MRNITKKRKPQGVALHPEGVDRNSVSPFANAIAFIVALHPEGVDRNFKDDALDMYMTLVALHPEGVDRNKANLVKPAWADKSPSTRRAWIEIIVGSM